MKEKLLHKSSEILDKYIAKPHQQKAIDAVFNHENGFIQHDETTA